MNQVRILNAEEIESIFTLDMALSAVESAYLQKAGGEGDVWPMVFHEFDPGHADLDIKSGHLTTNGIYGLKVVSWFESNPQKGLPALIGASLLFDLSTGAPKALLNAGPITDLRTGAAAAIGCKALARKDSKVLAMVGSGAIAPYAVAATLRVMPQLEEVILLNPHHPEKVEDALASFVSIVDHLLPEKRTAEIHVSTDLPSSVGRADIILTATPARQPVVLDAWVKPGTHISSVGADMSGKQELESSLTARAHVFCDDLAQSLSVGECEIPKASGLLSQDPQEIGALLRGAVAGRSSAEEITLFDSTGIALQDLASGSVILEAAEAQNLGTVVSL